MIVGSFCRGFTRSGGLVAPILVRPVREQLEHDRIIRLLQTRYRRRYEVAANVGDEQGAQLKVGEQTLHPDLVLTSTDRGRRLYGVVEVETAESVNHLEAMAQWANFGRGRAAFHLYVPASMIDVTRRLCAAQQVTGVEIWTYHTIGDQTRFTLVQKPPAAARAPRAKPAGVKPAARANAPGRSKAAVGRKTAATARGRGAARRPARKTRPQNQNQNQKRK
jgi:hypothetical protein